MSAPPSRPRLIAVNRFYWPDHSATSQILTDLCDDLASYGVAVHVVTSRQRYENPTADLPARESVRGVEVERVWTTRFGRDRPALRAIDYASFYLSASLALWRRARAGDVILAKTDPPLISIPAACVAWLRQARLVNWLQDVFPEIAGALGMGWARGPAGRVLARLRDWSLAAAQANVAICDVMAEHLAARGIDEARLTVIENWSCGQIHPVAHADNPLRAAWGLQNRLVIGYSGNLGRAHMAPQIIDLMRRTADIDALSWVFIGSGAGLSEVRAAAETMGIDAQFRPYQPRERLSQSLSVPDLHLVTLDPACEGTIMPSKLYGALAAGRGVIVLGAPDGGPARLVAEAGCGLVLDSGAAEQWRDQIAAIASREETARLGSRARASHDVHHRAAHRLAQWRTLLAPQAVDLARAPLGTAA